GALAEVKAASGKRHIALGFAGARERANVVLGDRSLVANMDDFGASAEIALAPGAEPGKLLAALVQSGVELSRFEVVEPSLQSIFIDKVGADAAHAARTEEAA